MSMSATPISQTQQKANQLDLDAFRRALQVRPATRVDLAFIAWCNYEASSPAPNFCYWDPLLEGLDTPAMTFIEAMFHADALGYGRVEDFFVVELEGAPIAGASGFSMNPDDYRPLHLSHLPQLAKSVGGPIRVIPRWLPRHRGSSSVWR